MTMEILLEPTSNKLCGIMEMEQDIENMALNEYFEYEAEKENSAFDYPHYHEDIEINKYHGLPPLHPCFQPAQPYTEDAKQGLRKNPLNDHSYNFTPNFYDQSPYTPNPQHDDKELSFEEDYNNLVRMGVKNLRKQAEAKVDDCNEGNMDDIWDITVEDIEIFKKLFTPTVVREEERDNDVVSISIQVPGVIDDMIQPLIPQTLHSKPPDKDYLAPAIKSIIDELLEEFRDEILILPWLTRKLILTLLGI
ncbi:hypothetical protein Tco_0393399 [Tanacetum coccineum]